MSTALEHSDLPRKSGRFVAFVVIAAVLFAVLGGRLFQLQVIEGTVRAQEAEAAHTVTVPIPAERGLIFDRLGRPLVVNVPTWTVAVRPADLPAHRREAVLARVAAVTGTPMVELAQRLDAYGGSPLDLVPLVVDVGRDAALVLSEEAAALPGIEVQVVARRQYRNQRGEADGSLLAHVTGYTGPINATELDALGDEGYLHDDVDGTFRVRAGDEVTLTATIDGAAIDGIALAEGVSLPAGSHAIAISGTMKGERWALVPEWNGAPVWQSAAATMALVLLSSCRPNWWFTTADARLTWASALMISRGWRSPEMSKFCSERCVCAPHRRSAGTSMGPKVSRSMRKVGEVLIGEAPGSGLR